MYFSCISKKSTVVSKSSTEAEYHAIGLVLAELSWVKYLLHELKATALNVVMLSANPILHSRTKHIELDIYFVREKVQQKQIMVSHVSPKNQVADLLTKPFAKSHFLLLSLELKISELPLSLPRVIEVI